MSVHFGLLGPVQLATEQQGLVELGPPQRRSVLAMLLLGLRTAVPVAALRERIWADVPPTSAATAIQVHVHHLRRILSPLVSGTRPRLLTHPGATPLHVSYEIDAAPGSLDVTSFRKALDEGELAWNRGEITQALNRFDAALALWRGDPMPELQSSSYVLHTRQSLVGMRRDAVTQRARCLLELGSLTAATDALQGLRTEHPDDERLITLLATSLHRAGAEERALRLVTDELDRRAQSNELSLQSLLRQRDLMVQGLDPLPREGGGAA